MFNKNNYSFIFLLISFLSYITSIYAENDSYIVAIRRKKTDKNYDFESKDIQQKIDKLVNDRMNDIYEIIEEKKETYTLENGEIDEKVRELENTSQLRKRSNFKKTKFLFINKTRRSDNINLKKRSYELAESNNSTVEFIPLSSKVVDIVCPIKNYYAIKVYLSDETKEIVCKLENVVYCEKVPKVEKIGNYHPVDKVNEDDNDNKSKRKRANNSKSKSVYYDINKIKNETNWSGVSVQTVDFTPNHLAYVSQAPYFNMNEFYDNNYYYPSSAGKGIDIYFVDEGLNTYHDDFDTSSGRTITCDAFAGLDGLEIITGEERYNCTGVDEVPSHGIMVASAAGGTIYGTAKKANLHMVAIDFSGGSSLKGFDYIAQHAKPYKTVVSLSIGSGNYSKAEEDKIQELLDANCIIVTAAGNGNMNGCEPPGSDDFNAIPGFRKSIVIGGVSPKLYGDGYYRVRNSNYGDCVDFFAPVEVVHPDLTKNSRTAHKTSGGTSCSAPVAAGVVATIMSENPDTKFTLESMKEKLIELSIKDAVYNRGSSDTPNRFINNGKHSVYSNYSTPPCGKVKGSTKINTCSDGCCTLDNVCLPYSIVPWKYCYNRFSCKVEYGECFEDQVAIDKCDKELEENKKCLGEITPSLDNLDERLEKCNNLRSDKCETFYRKLINELSYCNFGTYIKSYKEIRYFKHEQYDSYLDICENNDYINFKKRCRPENDKYKECFIDGNINFYDYSNFGKITERCSDITSEKCSTLYNKKEDGLKKYLPNCQYTKDYHGKNLIQKWTGKNIYFDDRYEVYDQYKQLCQAVPEKSVQICNKILNENKECLLTKDSGNNNNFDCKTFKSEKCQNFYRMYNNNGFVCKVAQKYSSFDFINKFDNNMYKQYQDKCEMVTLQNDAKRKWIYNASVNKCIYAQSDIDSVPLLKECKSDASFIWYKTGDYTFFSSALNTKRFLNVLDLDNPVITLSYRKNNDHIYYQIKDGLIFPDELRRKRKRCVSVNGSNSITLKTCNKNSNDQQWILWDENPQEVKNAKTRTVWIYNRKLNMCIESGEKYNDRPTIVECSNVKKSKWEIPVSGNGFFRSLHQGYCLNLDNVNEGKLIMKECNEKAIIMDINSSINGKMILSSLHNNKCLGSYNPDNPNELRLKMNRCNDASDDQQWEIWDTNPAEAYQTVWIYNKKLDKCIYSNSKNTNRPTYGVCRDRLLSQWKIHNSANNGDVYFKSATNDLCMNVSNIKKGNVLMGECNDDSLFKNIKSTYNKESIISIKSDDKCLGTYDPDNLRENRLHLQKCNKNDIYQHWEIRTKNPGEILCGKKNNNRKCVNSQCCSKNGSCGVTNEYCGTGCQSGLCIKSD